MCPKKIYLIFLVKNNEKSLPKKSEKFWSWKIGEKKKCEKTLFFRREKKMWKNPIFQERKKNVKKPYFSGEKKKCQKTLVKKKFLQDCKKNSKNFYSQIHCKKNSKNFYSQIHCEKKFEKFWSLFSVEKKTSNSKIFSPEILSIFFFGHEKIFGRKILSIWKKVCHKKKSFFQKVFANFLAFFPQKKKKIFFFSGPQNS